MSQFDQKIEIYFCFEAGKPPAVSEWKFELQKQRRADNLQLVLTGMLSMIGVVLGILFAVTTVYPFIRERLPDVIPDPQLTSGLILYIGFSLLGLATALITFYMLKRNKITQKRRELWNM